MELVQIYNSDVEEKINNIDTLIEGATEFILTECKNKGYTQDQSIVCLRSDVTLKNLQELKCKIYSLAMPEMVFIRYGDDQ